MTKNNLPIPRPEQNGALSLQRATQLLDITDKILSRSRQEMALQNEAWMVRLWAWANENEVPDLQWLASNYYDNGEYCRGLPKERKALLNLTELRLVSMQLVVLPPEIGRLQQLQSLILWDNELVTLPPEIGQLQQLQTLALWGNQLTSLPSEIGELQQLQALELWGNPLTSLPPEIGRLQQLKSLNLGGITGCLLHTLPPEFGQLQQLRALNLENNHIINLPPEIGQLQQLQKLRLRGNQLSSLPKEIGRLQQMQTLDLSHNQLTTLPPEIGQLQQLQRLYFSHNPLTILPPEIGQLQQLQKLCIDRHGLHLLPPALLLKEGLLINDENGLAISLEDRRRQGAMATSSQSQSVTRSKLIAERYRDNGDGTVTDVTTGLQWKRCAEGQTWTGVTCSGEASEHNWEDACELRICFAGYSDWRLPTIDELKTLVYCSSGLPKTWNESGNFCGGSYISPTIQTEAFPNTPSSYFWSGSPYAYGASNAWFVNFSDGYAYCYLLRSDGEHVRLVRGGQ